MVWPTQNTTRDNALKSVDTTARDLKSKCNALRVKSISNDLTAYEIVLDLLPKLIEARSVFNTAAQVPGILDFTAAERGVPASEISQSFQNMQAAITNCISWIETNLPKTGGYLQIQQITTDGSGVITPRMFNSALTAGLRTQLQAVEDAIA